MKATAKKKAAKHASKSRPAARRSTHKKKVVRKKPSVARSYAPSRSLSTTLPALVLGEICPGRGGVYVGDIRGENGQPPAHLFALAGAMVVKGTWGPTSKVAGAQSCYDGMANTKAMAAAGSEVAKQVLALKHEGHNDYYIGAGHEARLGDINGRGHFPKGAWLWTSTQDEFGDGFAWLQKVGGNGGQGSARKSGEYRVFVLRRQPIQ